MADTFSGTDFPFGQAGQAQFYDKSSNLGFALSVDNASATDLYFQISTPIGAGWGAIGSGDKMDRSLMFIIYPSSTRNGGCMLSGPEEAC